MRKQDTVPRVSLRNIYSASEPCTRSKKRPKLCSLGVQITTRAQAYSDKPDPSEDRFANKMRSFRELFGNDYYLVLIVPSRFIDRVEMRYPAIFDEMYVGADIPELLYKLQSIDT